MIDLPDYEGWDSELATKDDILVGEHYLITQGNPTKPLEYQVIAGQVVEKNWLDDGTVKVRMTKSTHRTWQDLTILVDQQPVQHLTPPSDKYDYSILEPGHMFVGSIDGRRCYILCTQRARMLNPAENAGGIPQLAGEWSLLDEDGQLLDTATTLYELAKTLDDELVPFTPTPLTVSASQIVKWRQWSINGVVLTQQGNTYSFDEVRETWEPVQLLRIVDPQMMTIGERNDQEEA